MTILVAMGMAAALLGAVGLVAYASGRRRGRVILPAALIAELREHKVGCIGEPAERVSLEIALLCDADASLDAAPQRPPPRT